VSDIVESARNIYLVDIINPNSEIVGNEYTFDINLTSSNFDFSKVALSGINFRLFDGLDDGVSFGVESFNRSAQTCSLISTVKSNIAISGSDRYYLYLAQTGVLTSTANIVSSNEPTIPLEVNIYPFVGDTSYIQSETHNIGDSGTGIIAGSTTKDLTLVKEQGSNARTGSGTCAKLTPISAVNYGYWYFYIPTSASTEFILSLYFAKSLAGFNGSLKISIYDTDQSSLLLDGEAVDLSDSDTDYHQHICTGVTPTDTGFSLVRIECRDGSTSGSLYIDDIDIT
jgi:hypothetical protein